MMRAYIKIDYSWHDTATIFGWAYVSVEKAMLLMQVSINSFARKHAEAHVIRLLGLGGGKDLPTQKKRA